MNETALRRRATLSRIAVGAGAAAAAVDVDEKVDAEAPPVVKPSLPPRAESKREPAMLGCLAAGDASTAGDAGGNDTGVEVEVEVMVVVVVVKEVEVEEEQEPIAAEFAHCRRQRWQLLRQTGAVRQVVAVDFAQLTQRSRPRTRSAENHTAIDLNSSNAGLGLVAVATR